jgi:anti-anti-sigma factor
VVAVAGELYLTSSPRLKQTLWDLLRDGRRELVLDFSRVSFMDSTALSVLVGIQRRLATDERLAIAGAETELLNVFELSGLAASIPVFPTLDAALAYARNGAVAAHAPTSIPLTGDAALMIGIASTAMPFAQSAEDEAARWLRVLRRHGEAGDVLASLGVTEAPIREPHNGFGEPANRDDPDVIATVTDDARRIAAQRNAARVATTDVLLAVMHAYGATFDLVLQAHGADIDELVTQLAAVDAAVSER